MGLGRYNIDRYNLLPGNDLRYAAGYDMYSTLAAAVATSSAISPAYFCSQSMDAFAAIGYGYDVNYDLAVDMNASLSLGFFISPPYVMVAPMTASMLAHLGIRPTYQAEQSVSAEATAHYAAYIRQNLSADLVAAFIYDIAHYPRYDSFQALNAQFNMQPTTITVMSFDDIEIPPGGMLVIDSENCTAYLNNENVIDLYSGDFLWLSRMLLGLDASSNTSGEIDVKLLYRERFL